MEGKTFSETLAKHLNVLHDARRAFIESENSERIRKALSRKICTNNTVYENGDIVWYRRRNKWMGPGKVVFQDGKVIFVRHGAVLVRVSANRIVRKGEEYVKENIEGENIDNEKENTVASDSRNQARVTIDDNLDIDEGSDDDKVDDLENQVIDVSIENDEGSDHSEIDKEVVDMEETHIRQVSFNGFCH